MKKQTFLLISFRGIIYISIFNRQPPVACSYRFVLLAVICFGPANKIEQPHGTDSS